MSTTTTAATVEVTARAMAAFNDRYPNGPTGDAASSIATIAKAHGYKSSGHAGGEIKRIHDALTSGAQVVVKDGDGTPSTVAGKVDRMAVARDFHATAPVLLQMVDGFDRTIGTLEARIAALVADRDTAQADRDAAISLAPFGWDDLEATIAEATKVPSDEVS